MIPFSASIKCCVALALWALTFQGAGSADLPTDLSHRDLSIHWPEAFNPSHAPVFAHNDLLIRADCHHVWTRLVNVTDWPNWFILTRDVSIDGPDQTLHHGTLLHLRIFQSPITSRIDEYVPDSRLSWYPQGLDESAPMHYHTWHLVPEGAGCRVTTEETGIGPNDIKSPGPNSRLVHRAHDLWLASLRWTSEQ